MSTRLVRKLAGLKPAEWRDLFEAQAALLSARWLVRTRPTGRALPPTDEITSTRCRRPTNAIDRPSGENAGAVPRTTRRDAPPDTRRTVIHPRRTNATREPSADQDGELPRPIDRSPPGRPIHMRPPAATASAPRTDQTASETSRNC